jgi:hypothetical protein
MKRNLIYLLLFSCFLDSCSNLKQNETISLSNKSYNIAFQKLMLMNENPEFFSFKDAVLLNENAFHNDTLNLIDYNNRIDSIAKSLYEYIKKNNYENYLTAPNFSVYQWMTKPNELNNFKKCSYDFEDFMGDSSQTSHFVTKLLDTKTGNCVSLPYLYKILVEEMGGEARLSLAPNHVFIKHQKEEGGWTNVELTNGGDFPRDEWIIVNSNISEKALETGIYMKPLNNKETLSLCVFNLAQSYIYKYGYDENVTKIIDYSLLLDSNNVNAILIKMNVINNDCIALAKTTNKVELDSVNNIWLSYKRRIDELGYIKSGLEEYKDFIKSNNPEAKKTIEVKNED